MKNYENFIDALPPLRKNSYYIRVNLGNTISISGKLSAQFTDKTVSVKQSRDGKIIIIKEEPNAPLKIKVSNVINTDNISEITEKSGLKLPCVYSTEWDEDNKLWVCKYRTACKNIDKPTPSKTRKRKPEGMVISDV